MLDKIYSYCGFATSWLTMEQDRPFGKMRRISERRSLLKTVGDTIEGRTIVDDFLPEVRSEFLLVHTELRPYFLQSLQEILHLDS